MWPVLAGEGDLMRPAFHREATMSGYCQGVEYSGSIEHVFGWVTANGPAPNIEPRFARIEVIETIALVHLEVRGWSGKLAGGNSAPPTFLLYSSSMESGRSLTSCFTGIAIRILSASSAECGSK